MPRVAAVIPTYSHFDFAHRAVLSFLRTTPESVAILVDDGSPDWPGHGELASWAPADRFLHYRFEKNDKNLTRSWNHGLVIARQVGAAYTVLTNSDVQFIEGWWPSLQFALDKRGVDLAGPLTNAPGHRRRQDWANYLHKPSKTDSPDQLVRSMQRVRKAVGNKAVWPVRGVNGFCLAAKTATWWTKPHGEDTPLDPAFKMEKNEDKLAARWRKLGRKIAIVPGSFVFHYRGVSRGDKATRGNHGKGHYRPPAK